MPTQTKAVTKSAEKLPVRLVQSLQATIPSCKRLLPPDVPEDKFRAALLLHLHSNARLLESTPQSIMDCCVKAASDGLLPGVDCYFLPFKGKASYVKHYQGIVRVLERTGKLSRAFAHPVYEGDEFWIDYFQTPPASHKPALEQKRGKVRFYYGAIIQKDGTMHVEPMTLDEIEAIRKQAPGGEQDAWLRFPVMMSRKTALKRVAKYCQLTEEQFKAIEDDPNQRAAAPSDAQHAQNIVDLFGDRQIGYVLRTQETPYGAVDTESGEVLEGEANMTAEGVEGVRMQIREILDESDQVTDTWRAEAEKALSDLTTSPGYLVHLLETTGQQEA